MNEPIEVRDPRDARVEQLEAELAAANETLSKLASEAHAMREKAEQAVKAIAEERDQARATANSAMNTVVNVSKQLGVAEYQRDMAQGAAAAMRQQQDQGAVV